MQCSLDLNGSAWSTEKKYMIIYKGKCDIFFGIEHRIKKEEIEDTARITDERAGSEDRKHTSGGGRRRHDCFDLRQRKKNRPSMGRGGLRVFSVYFWHSEGWTPRNEALLEAVVKQANTTRHSRLVACDANTCPEDLKTKKIVVSNGADA